MVRGGTTSDRHGECRVNSTRKRRINWTDTSISTDRLWFELNPPIILFTYTLFDSFVLNPSITRQTWCRVTSAGEYRAMVMASISCQSSRADYFSCLLNVIVSINPRS